MHFQRFGDRVQLRFESGEHVAQGLLDWLKAEGIGYAAMSGLGAVRSATVAYWNADSQEYESHTLEEQLEVVSLIGNVSLKDGEPFTHMHVGLGRRDLFMVGGHFQDAIVHPNLEIWLHTEADAVHRALDGSCGQYLMQLSERS